MLKYILLWLALAVLSVGIVLLQPYVPSHGMSRQVMGGAIAGGLLVMFYLLYRGPLNNNHIVAGLIPAIFATTAIFAGALSADGVDPGYARAALVGCYGYTLFSVLMWLKWRVEKRSHKALPRTP